MRNKLTSGEIHAFLIGLFEVLCPFRPRAMLFDLVQAWLGQKYHYYLGGRALGFITVLGILVALAKIVLGVIL